jgi:hypothetical protein
MAKKEVTSDQWFTPFVQIYKILSLIGWEPGELWYDPTPSEESLIGMPPVLRDTLVMCEGDFLETTEIPDGIEYSFMNSPYSNAVGGAGAFTKHLLDIAPRNKVALGILLNISSSTGWFQDCIERTDFMLMPRGRMKFECIERDYGDYGRWTDHQVEAMIEEGTWDCKFAGVDPKRVVGSSPRYENAIFVRTPYQCLFTENHGFGRPLIKST